MTDSMNNEPEQPNQPQQPWAPTPTPAPTTTPTPAPAPVVVPEPFAPQAAPQILPQTDPYAPAPQPVATPAPSYQPVVPQAPQPLQPTPLVPVSPSSEPQPSSPFQPQQQPQFAAQPPVPPSNQVQPPAKSKKGLIIGLAAGAAALILLVAAALVYLNVFYVSKEDYVQVQTQITAIDKDVQETPSLAGASLSGSGIDGIKDKADDLEKANEKLVGLKALKNDSDLKQKYEAYIAASDKAIVLMKGYAEGAEKFIPVADLIDTQATNGFTVSGSQTVITSLESLGDLSDETLQEFKTTLLDTYKKVNAAATAYESAPTTTNALTYRTEILAAADTISSSSAGVADKVKDRRDAIKLEEAFNAFSDAVDAKVNK
jgi:hypothetical protein